MSSSILRHRWRSLPRPPKPDYVPNQPPNVSEDQANSVPIGRLEKGEPSVTAEERQRMAQLLVAFVAAVQNGSLDLPILLAVHHGRAPPPATSCASISKEETAAKKELKALWASECLPFPDNLSLNEYQDARILFCPTDVSADGREAFNQRRSHLNSRIRPIDVDPRKFAIGEHSGWKSEQEEVRQFLQPWTLAWHVVVERMRNAEPSADMESVRVSTIYGDVITKMYMEVVLPGTRFSGIDTLRVESKGDRGWASLPKMLRPEYRRIGMRNDNSLKTPVPDENRSGPLFVQHIHSKSKAIPLSSSSLVSMIRRPQSWSDHWAPTGLEVTHESRRVINEALGNPFTDAQLRSPRARQNVFWKKPSVNNFTPPLPLKLGDFDLPRTELQNCIDESKDDRSDTPPSLKDKTGQLAPTDDGPSATEVATPANARTATGTAHPSGGTKNDSAEINPQGQEDPELIREARRWKESGRSLEDFLAACEASWNNTPVPLKTSTECINGSEDFSSSETSTMMNDKAAWELLQDSVDAGADIERPMPSGDFRAVIKRKAEEDVDMEGPKKVAKTERQATPGANRDVEGANAKATGESGGGSGSNGDGVRCGITTGLGEVGIVDADQKEP